MKKIIIFALFLLLPQIIFAEEVQLEPKYEKVLESFFQSIKENKHDEAYGITSKDFQQETDIDTFKKLLQATELNSFTEVKWAEMKKEVLGLFPIISGEFKGLKEKHIIQFRLLHEGEGLKIRSISETITIENLKKRLTPKKEILNFSQPDLELISTLMKAGKYQEIYESLSKTAKDRISKPKVLKALRLYKKYKINLKKNENAKIKIGKIYPMLVSDGRMLVRGNYKNEEAKNIKFTLYYDYEWEWKLGGFEFTVKQQT